MKRLLTALAIFLVSSLQAEVSIESIRTSAYDYACSCDDGFFSAHQRQDKAIASCATHKANNPIATCEVKGGTWRIGVTGANAQIGVSAPPPPLPAGNQQAVWTDIPIVNCTEGDTDGFTPMIPDFLNDPEGDVITLADGGGCTLPTGVTIDDPNNEVDCGVTTVAGTTTGCTLTATDATGSNITVTSPAFPITVVAAGGGSGYEDILTDMVGFADHYGVTGGSGGPLVTVTNCNNSGAGSLRQTISDASGATWIRFAKDTTCTINLSTLLQVKDDITIDGRGSNVTLRGPGGGTTTLSAESNQQNFVLMYFTVDGTIGNNNDTFQLDNSEGGDEMSTTKADTFWMYHMSFLNGEDETVSFRRSRGRWTVQSCYIENLTGTGYAYLLNNKSLGGGESNWDQIQMEGTFHRTHFKAKDRLVRQGITAQIHYNNNYISDFTASTATNILSLGTDLPGEGLFDGNIWEGAVANRKATRSDQTGWQDGWIKAGVANLFLNGESFDSNMAGSVFTPPYSYSTATANAALKTALIAEAGWQNIVFPGDP